MPITTRRRDSEELTEHVVTGLVTDGDMIACERAFYEGDPTRLQLWDMTDADLTEITNEGLQEFVGQAARLGQARENGRTAVIVQTDLQYGLGRMAEAFGEIESLPFALSLFHDRSEAIAWLKEHTV